MSAYNIGAKEPYNYPIKPSPLFSNAGLIISRGIISHWQGNRAFR